MNNGKNIAIIPARSGSKGLADKNIKILHEKPLLAYSIEAAKDSGIFDEIYVSTDSEEYAKIALLYGAHIPFLRSKETASDTASSWDVVKESIARYEQIGMSFSMVTLLQPTSPLRKAEDIRNAYDLYQNRKANLVVSVCEVEHSPLWCNTLPEDHSMEHFIHPEISTHTRQNLDRYYRINGAIYMVSIPYLKRCQFIYEEKSVAYIMDKARSIDIDDEYDFKMAEALMGIV